MAKRVLQATSQANYQFMNNSEKALAFYNQRLKKKDPAVIGEFIGETYQYFATTLFSHSQQGILLALEMIA